MKINFRRVLLGFFENWDKSEKVTKNALTRFFVFDKLLLNDGDIAQLVERLNGIEKVRGSTPLISTNHLRY